MSILEWENFALVFEHFVISVPQFKKSNCLGLQRKTLVVPPPPLKGMMSPFYVGVPLPDLASCWVFPLPFITSVLLNKLMSWLYSVKKVPAHIFMLFPGYNSISFCCTLYPQRFPSNFSLDALKTKMSSSSNLRYAVKHLYKQVSKLLASSMLASNNHCRDGVHWYQCWPFSDNYCKIQNRVLT